MGQRRAVGRDLVPLTAPPRVADHIIPFVIVDDSGTATFTIPISGKRVGVQIPLDATLAFHAYPLRVAAGVD